MNIKELSLSAAFAVLWILVCWTFLVEVTS